MHKISKFLEKLDRSSRKKVEKAIELIYLNQLDTLDCIKLQGFQNLYRLRVGSVRLVFRKNKIGNEMVDAFFREKGYKSKY